MRMRYVIFIGIIFFAIGIIGIMIFYNNEKPTANEIIEESVKQQEDPIIKSNQSEMENEEVIEESNEETSTGQFKDLIVNSVKNTVEFFIQRDVDIVAIGDSLTQGVGDVTNEGGYIGILDKTINHQEKIVSFENFGKAGHRTDQLLKRLDDPEIISAIKKSEIVLMTIGANDIMQIVKHNFANLTYDLFDQERIQFKNRIRETFLKIKEINSNTHIYLLGIYNPFAQYFENIEELDKIVNDWNQTSESTTLELEKTTFIPVKDLFENTTINLFSDDHFHPNKVGYHKMAERVLEYLTIEEDR